MRVDTFTLFPEWVEWFADQDNCRLVERLKAAGVSTEAPLAPAATPTEGFAGKTFVLTGRLEQLVRSYDPCLSCSTHFLDLRIVRLP